MNRFTLGFFRPYASRCALYVLLAVLSVLFTMATALSVADFLKILFDTDGTLPSVPSANLIQRWLDLFYRWLVSFGRLNALLLFSAAIFVLYSLKNAFSYASKMTMAGVRTRVVRDVRNRMFAKAMRLPMGYFSSHRKGDVLSRFSSDIAEYDENTIGSLELIVSAVVSLLLYLAMLFYLNLRLTLFVLCMLPVVGGVVAAVSHRLRRQSREVQEMNAHLVAMTDEAVTGLKVIKSYTAIGFVGDRFAAYNRRFTRRRTAMYCRMRLASPLSDFMGNVIVVGILLFGSSLIMGGNQGLTAELFISYIMLFVLMIPPAKDFTTALSQMRKGRACSDRLEAFLAEPEEPYAAPAAVGPAGEVPKVEVSKTDGPLVEFDHVSFAYTEGTPVLSDVSFAVPRGATVALVGSSGSGKSTIADLIGGYYAPQSGTIRFGGVDIRSLRLHELRSHIGVVEQETLLFNDTVEANIAFGTPSATAADIEAAARAAQAHDFIAALPDGYATPLGENGGTLSGGQRQRVSIARALVRRPDLLILDEATSALDTEAEHALQLTLDNLLVGHTALVIAHRLSTVRRADLILVLDRGAVVERGTHQSLLALGGRYAELVALQNLR